MERIELQSPPPCGSPRLIPSSISTPQSECILSESDNGFRSFPLSPSSSKTSLREDFSFSKEVDELKMIGDNFANQLCSDIIHCSNQLWKIHDQLIDCIEASAGGLIEVFGKKHELLLKEFYNRFTLVNKLSFADVKGEAMDVLEEHLSMFNTVISSPYME